MSSMTIYGITGNARLAWCVVSGGGNARQNEMRFLQFNGHIYDSHFARSLNTRREKRL